MNIFLFTTITVTALTIFVLIYSYSLQFFSLSQKGKEWRERIQQDALVGLAIIFLTLALSIFYGILGLLSGFLLCLKNENMIFLGLIIFVLKGVVDWSDGLLARVTNQTSNIGHIIDTWGSYIGYYSLIFGLGFICFNANNEVFYLILTLLIFLVSLIDFKLFSYHQLFYEVLNKKINLKNQQEEIVNAEKNTSNSILKKCKIFLNNFLDDRARTLDLICLIVFFEVMFDNILFTKLVLFLFLLKKLLVFLGNFIEIIILKKMKNKI
mgnify:CR=1 FL=1